MTDVEWTNVDEAGDIREAKYRFSAGASRCSIVRLWPSSFLIYSPGRTLAESALELLGTGSNVILLAPNAGHTLGLAEWKAAFPRALVVASSTAIPQVRKRSGLNEIQELSTAERFLPEHVSLHVLPACRWGEVWIKVDIGDKTIWIVCDAFFNLPALPDNRLIKTLMSLFRYGPGLEITRTFRYVGIKQRRLYREWVEQRLGTGRRVVLVPCHGNIYDDREAASHVLELTARRF